MAQQDARVRTVQRIGRRGLSAACVEGILATAAPYVAIMDGDLQHDETVLATMFDRIRQGDIDLVVGSRYVEPAAAWATGASERAAAEPPRHAPRRPAHPHTALRSDERLPDDPPRRASMRSLPQLSTIGFKILLDIAASAPTPLRTAEVPYTFRPRQNGESKLDSLVLWNTRSCCSTRRSATSFRVRFLTFAMVGGSGVVVHFSILTALYVTLQHQLRG